jgi:hypothetical protein
MRARVVDGTPGSSGSAGAVLRTAMRAPVGKTPLRRREEMPLCTWFRTVRIEIDSSTTNR